MPCVVPESLPSRSDTLPSRMPVSDGFGGNGSERIGFTRLRYVFGSASPDTSASARSLLVLPPMMFRLRALSLPALVSATLVSCTVESQTVPTTANLTQHTVVVDGHPLALWEKSTATAGATPILLIHGRTWSGLPDFDLQVPGEDLSLMDGLVEEGFRAFALDLRGYGGTLRDSTGWNTPDRATNDAIATLEWIVAETGVTPVLFGWSYGSMVSQLAAQRRPELVRSLILFGYPTHPDAEYPEEGTGPTDPPMHPTTAEAAASDFIVPGSISQAAVDEYVRHALEADPIRADWTHLYQWGELDPAEVRVPTLIIHGEHDPLTPTPAQVAVFSRLGTADRALVTIPGGDHAAFLEAPRDAFIHALVGFVRRPR